jgi:hypothetical protein
MRKLRRFGIALALTLTFATGALGGIIDTPPEPQQASAPSSTTSAVVLSVIQVVLSVP